MRKLVIIATLAVLVGSAAGYTSSELENFKEKYNNQTSEVPDILGNIVGGETVNVHIRTSEGESVVGAKMEGLEIEEIKTGGFENSTMKVRANSSAVESVLSSDKPFEEVREKLDSNEISYSSTTTGGKVKLTVLNSLKELASIFGLNF